MQHVELTIKDHIATIVMNRPEVCNALNSQLVADLSLALSDVHQEKKVSAVVITGKGDHFSSGVDLKSFALLTELEPLDAQAAWFDTWRELTELCETILRFPKPVVAAVNGTAIGAGLAIALSADLIVMTSDATLRANAAERGLIGGLTAPLLSFRSGAAVAAKMLLTGSSLNAQQAEQHGLCCQVVTPDQIWVAANHLAQQCCDAPRESVQATKRMLNENIGEALLSQLSAGAAAGATICNTESAAEGIRAFVEKRSPQWP